MSFYIRPVKKNISKISLEDTVGLKVRAWITANYASIYNYGLNKTGDSSDVAPPNSILKSLEITTQGIGLLTRCKATVHVYSASLFETFYEKFVRPGVYFTANYGRPGGTLRRKTFRTYNFSMKMDRLGGFEVTLEGVAAGNKGIIEGPGWHNINVLRSDLCTAKNFNPFTAQTQVLCDGNRHVIEALVHDFWELMSAGPGNGACAPSCGNNWTKGAFQFFGDKGPTTQLKIYGYGYAYHDTKWGDKSPRQRFSGKGVFGRAEDLNALATLGWFSLATILRFVNELVLGDTEYEITEGPDNAHFFTFGESKPDWACPPDPWRILYACSLTGKKFDYFDSGNNAVFLSTKNLTTAMVEEDINGQICYNPMGIYISEICLFEIIEHATSSTSDVSGNQEDVEKSRSEMPLLDFFEKLFKVIRENTGGACDLTLDTLAGEENILLLVNKNNVPEKPDANDRVKLSIYGGAGSYGIRDITVTGKVPKALVSKMFGTAPDTTPTQPGLVSAASAVLPNNSATIPTTRGDDIAGSIGGTGGFGNIQSAKNHLKSWVSYYKNTGGLPVLDPSPLPLDLGFKVDGGAVLEFGNIVELSGLPDPLSGNDQVYWTITDVTEKISGNDWTTECKTVARLIPS